MNFDQIKKFLPCSLDRLFPLESILSDILDGKNVCSPVSRTHGGPQTLLCKWYIFLSREILFLEVEIVFISELLKCFKLATRKAFWNFSNCLSKFQKLLYLRRCTSYVILSISMSSPSSYSWAIFCLISSLMALKCSLSCFTTGLLYSCCFFIFSLTSSIETESC